LVAVFFLSYFPLSIPSPFVGFGSAKLRQELPLVALAKQASRNPNKPGFPLQSGLGVSAQLTVNSFQSQSQF
jgi:hypothetical protein